MFDGIVQPQFFSSPQDLQSFMDAHSELYFPQLMSTRKKT